MDVFNLYTWGREPETARKNMSDAHHYNNGRDSFSGLLTTGVQQLYDIITSISFRFWCHLWVGFYRIEAPPPLPAQVQLNASRSTA